MRKSNRTCFTTALSKSAKGVVSSLNKLGPPLTEVGSTLKPLVSQPGNQDSYRIKKCKQMQTNRSKCSGSEFGSKSSNIPLEGSQKLKIATPPRARSEKKVIPTEGGDAIFDFLHTSREIRVVRFAI